MRFARHASHGVGGRVCAGRGAQVPTHFSYTRGSQSSSLPPPPPSDRAAVPPAPGECVVCVRVLTVRVCFVFVRQQKTTTHPAHQNSTLPLHLQPARPAAVVASSDGPTLRKPEAAPPTPPSPPSEAAATRVSSAPSASGVTIEYQRAQAKVLTAYFKASKAVAKAEAAKTFGWTKANELRNGRWVMFGVGVGLLTEYATGVSLVDQLKLMVSYLGIADIYD